MKARVAIARCAEYQPEAVEAALRRSIDHLGGMGQFVEPGQRVVLKVNLLAAVEPDTAIVTHPAVVEAVVRLVQEAGGKPVIADSPGAGTPYTRNGLRRAYLASGLSDVAERTGAELNWDTSAREVSPPEAVLARRLDVINPVLDADVVITLPKLKTHCFTTFTGATKILFGAIPGFAKAGYHSKLHDHDRFADMLLDIVSFVKPALAVMDAVVGMDGDGPGVHGTPRPVGVLLASADSVALDVVACDVVGIPHRQVSTLRAAQRRGWWDGQLSSIEVVGDPLDVVRVSDFRMPAATSQPDGFFGLPWHQNMLRPLFKPAFTPRPAPRRGKCTACRTCVRGCPQDAITIRSTDGDKLAVVDDSQCIRCYCCHELCPEAAIELRFSWLGRVVRRTGLLGVRG